jgi:eukaryotic-like serine/threonine-protein kinase
VLALLLTATTALWQARNARSERDIAVREAARAEHIAGFLTGLFEAVRPVVNAGTEPSARELLDRAREQLAQDAAMDPPLLASLQLTIADSYRALGHYDEAENLLRSALDAGARNGDDDALAARLLMQLGRVHNFQARWTDAERVLHEAMLRAGDRDADIAAIQRQLAVSLINQQRFVEADAAAHQARAALGRIASVEVREIVDAEMLLATIAYARGDLASALTAYQGIVAAQRKGGAPRVTALVTGLNNLAAIEARLDHLDDAQKHYSEAVQLARATYGDNNREAALPLLGLGSAQRALGQTDLALANLSAARSIYRQWSGAAHADSAYASLLYAEMLWLSGRDAQALAALDGVADTLAHPGEHGVKACRTRLLRAALGAPVDSPEGALAAAVACLSAVDVPGNLQLQARFVALRLGQDNAVAADQLLADIVALSPRDGALQQAIKHWVGSLPAD